MYADLRLSNALKLSATFACLPACPDVSRGAISGKKTYIATQEGLVFIYKLNTSLEGLTEKQFNFNSLKSYMQKQQRRRRDGVRRSQKSTMHEAQLPPPLRTPRHPLHCLLLPAILSQEAQSDVSLETSRLRFPVSVCICSIVVETTLW